MVVWQGRSWGVREVGVAADNADIICIFCTRNETILPFMSAKMSWMSSPNSIKHAQIICIFNLIRIIITNEVITLECPVI